MLSRTSINNNIDLNIIQGGDFMKGSIATYQTCPKCGAKFPSSKGGFPIICGNGCQTQPTKFYIKYYFKGKDHIAYLDRSGGTIHHWDHAVAALGEIRSGMDLHKKGKGFFDPAIYQKQSKTGFTPFWEQFRAKYKGGTADKLKAIGAHLLFFEGFQMRDITSFNIDSWWDQIQQKGFSERYQNDILTWAKSFFKWAKQVKVIQEELVFPKSISIPEPEVDEWLTAEDQDAVFEKIPDCDKPIFDWLFMTGCRVNEACGLKRTDTDWKRGVTIIRHTVKRDGSVGATKNKKSRRILHSPSIKRCLLQSTAALHAEYQFINKWGRRYSDDYLRDTFHQACLDAGIEPIKLKNGTRHSAGMRLLDRGHDMEAVRKFYGHSTVRMTQHYAKILEDSMTDMFERGAEDNRIKVKK